MWIFADFGVIMPSQRPPETIEPGDPRTLQVRARRKVDLNRLRRHYMPTLGPTYAIPDTDYEYRADCTPDELAEAVARIVRDIDYVKFKPTTERWRDGRLHDAYLAVWAVLLEHLSPKRGPRRVGRARRRVRPQDEGFWGDGSPIGNFGQS